MATVTVFTRQHRNIVTALETAGRYAACRENVEILRRRGVHFAGPAAGHVACGADGTGRMVEAAEIAALIPGLLD